MVKLDDADLNSLKIIFRKLINKTRCGGNHTEITELYKWGLTKDALKYCINEGLLQAKKSQGNRELSVNSHKLKEIYHILNDIKDASELN